MLDEKTDSEPVIRYVGDNSLTEHVHIDFRLVLNNIFRSQFRQRNIFDRKQKFQAFLAVGAFITFGIGDGVTGALMMNLCGTSAEANPIMRYLIDTQGSIGLIMFKLWITMALLTIVITIQDMSAESTYWTTNGFLIAFGIGGVLATTSNLMRTFSFDIFGYSTPSPVLVILVYFMLTIGLVALGGALDNKNTIHLT
ncbi:MAG: hypothetical protein Q7J10_01835 [Methanosarcinaceae archaeon]|nr:hypothetical protein [Methanosarcinaceae archaeon]